MQNHRLKGGEPYPAALRAAMASARAWSRTPLGAALREARALRRMGAMARWRGGRGARARREGMRQGQSGRREERRGGGRE